MESDSQSSSFNPELFRAGCWHDLIFEDEESSKFWSIKIHKNTHIRRWGPIGAVGKELITEFCDAEEARKDARRLHLAKTKGGYRVRKPQLRCETELTHFVLHKTLNAFINRVYQVGHFKFIEDHYGVHDGDLVRFNIDGQVTKDSQTTLTKWIAGHPVFYITDILLNDCARQRLIPRGTYVIEVL